MQAAWGRVFSPSKKSRTGGEESVSPSTVSTPKSFSDRNYKSLSNDLIKLASSLDTREFDSDALVYLNFRKFSNPPEDLRQYCVCSLCNTLWYMGDIHMLLST